jgi:regulator of sigma E protease
VVAGAGLAASYLVASAVFTAAFLVDGKIVTTTEVTVIPGKPAAEAGMETGDRVVSVGGTPTTTWNDVADTVSRHPGEPVEVVVVRGGEEKHLTVTPQRSDRNKGRIGIAAVSKHEHPGLVASLGLGLTSPMRVLVGFAQGISSAIAGEVEVELAGPVGIVRETKRAARVGAGPVLHLAGALLSYVWPISAIVALASVPRRAKAARAVRT